MIMQAFADYRSSILDRKGKKAYELVDSNTKRYYDDIMRKILYATEKETKALSVMGRFMVVFARHQINPEDLAKMNGESLFVYAVGNGWIGRESVTTAQISISEINNDIARTHIVTPAGEAPFGYRFRRENKKWRIDLTSFLPITEMLIRQQIDETGIDENDLVFTMIRAASGFKPDAKVWQPVM